ncbi:hypothetical protein ACM55G_06610 [Flavobacterium sp. LB3P122]
MRIKIPQNGVCLFLIKGEIKVYNQILKARDAMGITFSINLKSSL